MSKENAGARRILLVQDIEEARDVLQQVLERDGYLVDAARNEEDAVSRVGCRRPDLILVALGGSAEEVISAARRIRGTGGMTESTPAIVFSISTVPEGSEQDMGNNVHVTFPDNLDQLRALMTRLLEHASRGN